MDRFTMRIQYHPTKSTHSGRPAIKDCFMTQVPDGEWVCYADYDELVQQLAAMQRIVDSYKDDLKRQRPDVVLLALQLAYRKHHLLDDSVGSTELSDALMTAICETIGDDNYQKWLDGLEEAGLDNRDIVAE